jgi:molybdopterin-guanine dinucleotide biosynthesis protein A
MTTMPLSGIVLAGGHSRRMGEDKALLSIHGIPLLRHVCQVALGCASSVTVVTPWPSRYKDVVPPKCHLLAETLMPTETSFESHSPLVGFYQGLEEINTDWVLLLACDMPQLKADVLNAGAIALPHVSAQAIAYLPQDQNGWQPLCGFYRKECLPNIQAFINEGGRSFQRWLEREIVEEWKPSDRNILLNCNTPEDWQNMLNPDANRSNPHLKR